MDQLKSFADRCFRKTEELIRRVKRAQIAKQRVQIFKPALMFVMMKKMWSLTLLRPLKSEPVENAVDILIRLKRFHSNCGHR